MKDCVFAPYFPAKEPYKFAIVHKIFGASNVNKMLQVKVLPLFRFGILTTSIKNVVVYIYYSLLVTISFFLYILLHPSL